MARHTTKVFGQMQLISRGFNEVQVLRCALVDTTIPLDEEMVAEGIVRIDWNGPSVESGISALNDNFAREIDNIVRHPSQGGLPLYGHFMVISNGFNDTLAITSVTIREGRVYVEKGDPVWSVPPRRI